jgi:pimeloyl-ACP methyl ester carboxylesterase
VSGTRVNYVVMGGGPPVLLIHGLGGVWQNWLETIPHLARERTTIAVDLPGFGRSRSPREPVSIHGYANFVESFLDALGTGETALVGSSMGGLIAAETAATRPGIVSRLVLVSAAGAGRRSGPAPAAGMPGLLRTAGAAVARRSGWVLRSAAVRRALLGRLMTHPERISPRIARAMAAGIGRPASASARRAVNHNDVGTRLQNITAPTLLVWGARDQVVPPYVASSYEQGIRAAHRVVLPDTGHVPMIERPALFNRLVSEFLSAT